MDLGNLPDVIRMEIIDFETIPDKAKEVLALRMVGMGSTKIARVLKMTVKGVEDYFQRYDPDNQCRVSAEAKRKITTEMLMTKGISALLEITDVKLQQSDAKELAAIASRCINTAEKIRSMDKGRIPNESNRIDSIMDSLDTAQVIEG